MPAGAGGCRVFGDDIGHNQPSIAVVGSGSIHVFTAMHGDDWIYYRASAAAGLDGFGDRSHQMPGFGSARITYPNLTRAANGDLYLIVRDLTSGKLYRWNNATNVWSLVTVFAREAGFSVYPDDVRATSDGQIHIAWEWAGGGAGALRHLGSYMRHDPATGNFYNAAGQQLAVPVTTNTSPTYAPLGPGESKTGGATTAVYRQPRSRSTPRLAVRLPAIDADRLRAARSVSDTPPGTAPAGIELQSTTAATIRLPQST
jgi:hypothetical protein